MPVTIRKVSGGKYRVSTPHGTKAKGTSLAKAKAQERLLNAVEHNPGFRPYKSAMERQQAKEGMPKGTRR